LLERKRQLLERFFTPRLAKEQQAQRQAKYEAGRNLHARIPKLFRAGVDALSPEIGCVEALCWVDFGLGASLK
jgi:hypothetical protein